MHTEQDPPPWLREPVMTKLLHHVLDLLDARKRPAQRLHLKVTPALLPALFDAGDEQDFCWELLEELQRIGVFDIKRPPDWRSGDDPRRLRLDFQLPAEDRLRRWLQRPRDLSRRHWLAAIASCRDCFPGATDELAGREIKIAGRTPLEVVQGFARIGEYLQSPISLRRLSARCFWGNSKVLDKRGHIVTSLYPGQASQLQWRPLLLSVYLPAQPCGVLVIENQDTFCYLQQGAMTAAAGFALVYIQGFKGTARRIREAGGVCFTYSGDIARRSAFESFWLGGGDRPRWPIFFWGDLDDAGMAILTGLKASFDNIDAWPPGYEPMLAALVDGAGHTPQEAGKTLQATVGKTGCPFADSRLIPALRQHGAYVDQEYVI